MAPNSAANVVEVVARPTTGVGLPHESPKLLSWKWTVGERWWHRSKYHPTYPTGRANILTGS